MKFEELEIAIDRKIEKIYNEIKKIEKDSCIAGSYLLNQYLNKKTNEVRFYIHTNGFNEVMNLLENTFAFELKKDTFYWNKQVIELVEAYKTNDDKFTYLFFFTDKGKKSVEYLTIRINEIYYDGKAYISNEAKKDIEEKVIRIGVIKHPIIAYGELIKTAISLQEFKAEKNSLEKIAESINYGRYSKIMVIRMIEKEGDEIKEAFMALLKNMEDKEILTFNIEKNHTEVLEYINQKGANIPRDMYEKLYEKDNYYTETKKHVFEKQCGLDEMKMLHEEFVRYFKKQSVKLMFHYPKDIKSWKDNIENEAYFYYLFRDVVKKERISAKHEEVRTIFKELENYYEMLDLFKDKIMKIPKEITFTYTNQNCYAKAIEPIEYIKDEILKVTIGELGYFILHKSDEEILVDAMADEIYTTLFKEMVFEKLAK